MEEISTNESEDISESLRHLKELIHEEQSLDCPKDDQFLLKFLRARKYDAEAAFKNVQKYFKARQNYPDVFRGFSPSEVLYDTIFRENKLLAVSSKRDALGRAVILVKTGAWDASICTIDEYTKACLVLVEWMLLDEEVQKRGIVCVFDYKGLGLHHLTQFTPFVVQRLVHIVQDCYPVRVKAVYVVNSPQIFDMLFSLAKTFLKSKLVQRPGYWLLSLYSAYAYIDVSTVWAINYVLHFVEIIALLEHEIDYIPRIAEVQLFGADLDKLHDVVPEDVIPEEAGGTQESYDYDKLEKDLLSHNDYFEEVNRYGYGKESTHC